uniref:Uncharacterized protein n=1 Tax=Lepeophtheirus salmonis TaxID=72036 RepID=A0A0K2SZX3_LEPSM
MLRNISITFHPKKEDLSIGHLLHIYFSSGNKKLFPTINKLKELCTLHYIDFPTEFKYQSIVSKIGRRYRKSKCFPLQNYKNWCHEPVLISSASEDLDNASQEIVNNSQLNLSNVSYTSIETQTEDQGEELKNIKKQLKQCQDKHRQLLKYNRDKTLLQSINYVKKEKYDEAVQLIVSQKEDIKKLNSEVRELTYQLINCETFC